MSDTEPRCPCPFCDQEMIETKPDVDVFGLACFGSDGYAHVSVHGPSKADCIRRATTMKLPDRLVREAAREALAKVAYLCNEFEADPATAIARVLKDYPDPSRRQNFDKSNEKGT